MRLLEEFILCIVPIEADRRLPLKWVGSMWLQETGTSNQYNEGGMNRICIWITYLRNWTLHIRNQNQRLPIHTDHSPKDSHSTAIEKASSPYLVSFCFIHLHSVRERSMKNNYILRGETWKQPNLYGNKHFTSQMSFHSPSSSVWPPLQTSPPSSLQMNPYHHSHDFSTCQLYFACVRADRTCWTWCGNQGSNGNPSTNHTPYLYVHSPHDSG